MVLLQLSQSQLTLIEQCPRKFQYIYLDQLAAPIPAEQREHLIRGSQLHHLMQQHELQLPASKLFPESPNGFDDFGISQDPTAQRMLNAPSDQLYQMVEALTAEVPTLDEKTVFRQSEYRLTLAWSDVLLTVIYDLLLLDTSQAHIFDWKTYLRPPNLQSLRQRLSNHWQTKLYPFVLVETSDYSPEAVDITYWFVKQQEGEQGGPNPFVPECLSFPYSDRLHQQTKQDLTRIIGQLQQWVEAYQHSQPLPQVDISQGLCSQCSFQMRCDRPQDNTDHLNWEALGNITSIPEIHPFQNPTNNP